MDIVTGVFDDVTRAEETVRAWMDAGIDADHIGIVTRNRDMGTTLARDMDGEYTTPSGDAFTGRGRVYDRLPDGYADTIRRSNLPDEAVDWYQHHLDQKHILVIANTEDDMDRMHMASRIAHEHGGMLYDESRRGEKGTERMATGTTGMPASGEMHVPIVEEEVSVEKRQHQVGEVRVTPEVTQERVEMPTTVTHEEIRVERRRLDRSMHPNEYQGVRTEGGELRIPIVEEEIRVTKTPVIREEMVITRLPVSEQQTIRETVRREDVHVETTGDVHVEGMTEEERRKRRPAA